MRTTAVIPIKLQNERLPGKNTALLGERPLISYCLEALRAVALIDDIYVYCSSEEIEPFLPEGVRLLLRPAELDSSTTNFTQIFDRFQQAVPSDVYVYAHATAPFMSTRSLTSAIEAVVGGQHDSAFTAEAIQDFLWKDGRPLNFDATNIPRSQDLPVVYRETSGFYVFTDEVFRTMRTRIGRNPYIVEVGLREAVDINTAADFALAQLLLDSDIQ